MGGFRGVDGLGRTRTHQVEGEVEGDGRVEQRGPPGVDEHGHDEAEKELGCVSGVWLDDGQGGG